MSIPLLYLLFPYAIIIGSVIIFLLVNLYHLLHYGFFYFSAALFSYLILGVTLIILFWSYQELSGIDWKNALLIIGG